MAPCILHPCTLAALHPDTLTSRQQSTQSQCSTSTRVHSVFRALALLHTGPLAPWQPGTLPSWTKKAPWHPTRPGTLVHCQNGNLAQWHPKVLILWHSVALAHSCHDNYDILSLWHWHSVIWHSCHVLTLALNVWSFCERYSSLLCSGAPLLYPHSKVACAGTLIYWK